MSRIFMIIIGILGILLFAGGITLFVVAQKSGSPLPHGTLTIASHTFQVEIANTLASRAQGLSGREGLVPREGMIFLFPIAAKYGFWMKDMRFALDMVWIKNNRVIEITENIPPPKDPSTIMLPSYYPPEAVDTVLEISAGAAKANGIAVGDLVTLERK